MIDGSESGAHAGLGAGWQLSPTRLPCPPWCDERPGHPFIDCDAETGALVRTHRLRVGQHVEIYAEEHAVAHEGPVWRIDDPRIFIGQDLFSIDADDAAQLASDLTAAMAQLGDQS